MGERRGYTPVFSLTDWGLLVRKSSVQLQWIVLIPSWLSLEISEAIIVLLHGNGEQRSVIQVVIVQVNQRRMRKEMGELKSTKPRSFDIIGEYCKCIVNPDNKISLTALITM